MRQVGRVGRVGCALGTLLILGVACAREPRHFADFKRQLDAMAPDRRSSAIESYLAAHNGSPIIENQTRLVFLVKDQGGETPRVVGDFNNWASTPRGYDTSIGVTTRVEGTEWSYLESSAFTNARLEYVLLFSTETRPDPSNTRMVQAAAGPHSEVRMPLWVGQPELDDRAPVPAGDVLAESFASTFLGGTRRIWYYTPPGYAESGDTLYPAVFVLDGGNYIERMDTPRVLDRLIAKKAIPPVIAVFSEPADRVEEYSRNQQWRAFVATELVPAVDKRFRTFPTPDHRAILGSSLAAYGAVDLAIEYPSVFGLSAALAPPAQTISVITNQAKAKTAAVSIRFFVLGGLYDPMLDAARRLRVALDDVDAPITYLEVPEGHGTETFRAHLDDAIRAIVPR